MHIKKLRTALISIAFLGLFTITQNCFAVLNLPPAPTMPDAKKVIPDEDIQRLALTVAYIKQYYIKKVDEKALMDNAISGMLAKLDPHSDYLDETDLKDLELVTVGHFGGIGVEVIPDQGLIRVVSPIDDTPAYNAGIKANDIIVKLNNKLVKDMTLRDAIGAMRGPKGSKLTLTILRKNNPKPLNFVVLRDTIKVKTVRERILEPNYGYIRISFFQDPTEKELAKAIARLKKKNRDPLKGVILDLRNNPGGLLESAIQVADDFLDSTHFKDNKLIVYTEGQFEGSRITANATPDELMPGVPIVVLINEGSASAAEIVAGALQDHKRALIAGTRSFGKGSVQTLLPLDEKSAIKLTTALYYTPKGRSIQAKGIKPDVTINQLEIAKNDALKNNLRIDESNLIDHLDNGNANDEENDAENLQKTANADEKRAKSALSAAQSDYQLYEALNLLKGLNVLPR